MKKILLLVMLVAVVLAASGCRLVETQVAKSVFSENPVAESALQETSVSVAEAEPEMSEADASETGGETVADPFEGLVKDEYPELVITADVLIRRAILPGTVIPVTVGVQNNGDKTVAYVLGSGSFETPEAIIMQMNGLQPVVPRDRMGIMTLDFVVKELKPGESMRHVFNVLAIEPNARFNKYSHDLYFEKEQYIADIEWPTLKEMYLDLVAAKPGTYDGTVSFRYTMLDGQGQMNPFGNPTGYAQTDLRLTVTG